MRIARGCIKQRAFVIASKRQPSKLWPRKMPQLLKSILKEDRKYCDTAENKGPILEELPWAVLLYCWGNYHTWRSKAPPRLAINPNRNTHH